MIALNVTVAILVLGGIGLSMWLLYWGLDESRPRTRARRQPRPAPGTAKQHAAIPAGSRPAWSAR